MGTGKKAADVLINSFASLNKVKIPNDEKEEHAKVQAGPSEIAQKSSKNDRHLIVDEVL
jgi:hypothetical protein